MKKETVKPNTAISKPVTQEVAMGEIRRITWIGLVTNILLAAIKFLVGILGASQAVIADAVHSLSDMVTDFAVIFGVKFWSTPDENHPYGHGRIETLVTTTIGLLLAAVAVGLGYNALSSVRGEQLRQATWIAVTGPLASIILKEIIFRWTLKVGHRVRSTALTANAWHHRSDALSSIPALAAVIASAVKPEWAFVDRIGAIVVSIFILKVSWDILHPALSELTESSASARDIKQIHAIAASVEGVKEIHAVRTRKHGSDIYVDLHALVAPDITVRQGHDIAEAVRHELISCGPGVLDVVVHVEPYETDQVLASAVPGEDPPTR